MHLSKEPVSCFHVSYLLCSRGRYYYWETETDNVSWHSPQHPKAKIGRAAADLRLKLISSDGDKQSIGPMIPSNKPISVEGYKERDKERDRSYHDNRFKKPDPRDRRRRNRGDDDELDPMDPSSYSDVPRYVITNLMVDIWVITL